MDKKEKYKNFNKILNKISPEEIQRENKKHLAESEEDFKKLKESLLIGKCSYCGYDLTHFSVNKPCFHWLLKPKGFKNKHFPLIYKELSFHEMESYLRWVANCESPIKNINDLEIEKSSSKIIEETIKYKNLEWSFSCSKSDMTGHKDAYGDGKLPHFHFQMKVDGNVVINYGGFHIPFNDYDEFCFAAKRGEFEKIKACHIHGAGMQTMFDRSPEELLDIMKKAPGDDESRQQFNISTIITADEGTTISGNDLADIIIEHNNTGVPIAKLIKKLKNVTATSLISPGSGVPEIANRKPNRYVLKKQKNDK